MTAMLEYKIRQSGDVTILDLSGRISVGEALAFGPGSGGVLGDVLLELAKKGQRKVLLNLKDAKNIYSSGGGGVVGAFTTLRRQGGELQPLSPAPTAPEVRRSTHLHNILQ